MSERRGRGRILSEETVRRAGEDGEQENPYWLDEEPEPYPEGAVGCVRRGLCCRSSPGWFGPGEVEQAAALLGLEADELVRRHLVIDAIEVDGRSVEVFVPVKTGRDGQPLRRPATRVDRLYRMLRGPCVFFEGSGCRIYAARPIECRRYLCTHAPEENLGHDEIARLWLAGREE